MPRVLFVFGTRPEAIKLAPVVTCFREHAPWIEARVCVTAQHRGLLDQVLEVFGVTPDYDLNIMAAAQTLFQSTAAIVRALEPVFADARPAFTIVQGDTTTTLCGALCSFYARTPVAHVEAGLRTGDYSRPFPEEMNRVVTSRIAGLHFAPTAAAAENLRAERVPDDRIMVTGNTGIDALLRVCEKLDRGEVAAPDLPVSERKLVLVTAHRRESFGPGFDRICGALRDIASRSGVDIVFPVHPNPNVSRPVYDALGGLANVKLVAPLAYVPFVALMRRAHVILTDSGGIQEEAPSLGKPVLVLRETTERPEGVASGAARLVGTDRRQIVEETGRLLDDSAEYARRARVQNPYGDGRASRRIVDAIAARLAVENAPATVF